ncbi:MAG TPA: T9SS type A sorting domain-containing protein, partial [Saprospiraceae bacterium]|nr:T9SS type A sorting domain-containing protein [Saprospiraceae bacterium]
FYDESCGEIASEIGSFTTADWMNNHELSKLRVSIHPNPMHEFLFVEIEGAEAERGEVWMVNEFGQLVYKQQLQSLLENGRINTSNLVSGTYVLKIATQDSFFTTKVIKH